MAGSTLSQAAPSPAHFADLLNTVASKRDRGAFAELYQHFAPRLKSYLRRRGSGEGQAEEIVQEVMLTVWRRAELYDRAQANVSTWIFTIARNRRIDVLRRERRPEYDPNDPALTGTADPAPDASAVLEQEGEILREAVESVPEEQAQLLRMAFYEDKSHTAIAEELGLPLGTVKSRIRLALQKLRRTLEDKIDE